MTPGETSASSDSHETSTAVQTPSVAHVDGWEIESSSLEQPTPKELEERFKGGGPAPAAEPAKSAPAEPEGDDEDETPDRETPAEDPNQPKKKKLTAAERKAVLQAEFNALTRQKEEARRALAREQQELDQLRKSREAEATKKAEAKVPETKEAASELKVADGQPDWDEYEAAGKSFKQYQVDVLAYFKAEATKQMKAEATSTVARLLAEERKRAIDEAEVQRADERRAEAQKKYPDWKEKIAKNLADVPQTPFLTTVVERHPAGMDLLYTLADHPAETAVLSTLQWTRPIFDAVRSEPDPAPLLLYFARHPEEHDEIAHLDPASALMALGRLSTKLSLSSANTGSLEGTRPVTSAKPPIRPVSATRSASTGDRDPDDIEFGPEYVRLMNERRARARG